MEPCSRALQKCSPRPNRHPRLGPANDDTVPKAFVRFRTASYRVFALPPREASLLAPGAPRSPRQPSTTRTTCDDDLLLAAGEYEKDLTAVMSLSG